MFLPLNKLSLGSYRVGALTACAENLLVLCMQTLDLVKECRPFQDDASVIMFMCRKYASAKMQYV